MLKYFKELVVLKYYKVFAILNSFHGIAWLRNTPLNTFSNSKGKNTFASKYHIFF